MNKLAIEPTTIGISELVALVGYKRAQANFMKVVLDCAVETLLHAEKKLEQNWIEFCEKKGALLKPKKTMPIRPNENAITYELADYIDEFLKALPVDHRYRGSVTFHNEKPKSSKNLAGSTRKRLDFRYEASFIDGPELVIEAKPLFSNAEIKKKYFGAEGLGRFTRHEESYTSDDLGGLLAYVPKDQYKTWQDKIRETAFGVEGFQSIIYIDIGDPMFGSYSTQHKRELKTSHIWMLHFLLKYPHEVSAA